MLSEGSQTEKRSKSRQKLTYGDRNAATTCTGQQGKTSNLTEHNNSWSADSCHLDLFNWIMALFFGFQGNIQTCQLNNPCWLQRASQWDLMENIATVLGLSVLAKLLGTQEARLESEIAQTGTWYGSQQLAGSSGLYSLYWILSSVPWLGHGSMGIMGMSHRVECVPLGWGTRQRIPGFWEWRKKGTWLSSWLT